MKTLFLTQNPSLNTTAHYQIFSYVNFDMYKNQLMTNVFKEVLRGITKGKANSWRNFLTEGL